MTHELAESNSARILSRYDPVSSLISSYFMAAEDYHRLVADGLDPEAIADDELSKKYEYYAECDALRRVATVTAKPSEVQVLQYCFTELVSDGDG